ncbi:MAG: pilin [Nitrospirales bacterium]|nr:MAG: pilin [Nitrospirales bacterium]
MNSMYTFLNDEEGATAMEYGLLAALISAVIIGAVQTLGTQITVALNTVSTAMGNVTN